MSGIDRQLAGRKSRGDMKGKRIPRLIDEVLDAIKMGQAHQEPADRLKGIRHLDGTAAHVRLDGLAGHHVKIHELVRVAIDKRIGLTAKVHPCENNPGDLSRKVNRAQPGTPVTRQGAKRGQIYFQMNTSFLIVVG